MRKMVCLLSVLLFATSSILAAEVKSVTVSAGKIDRRESIGVFPLSGDPLNTVYELIDDGERLQVQKLSDKSAMFILPELNVLRPDNGAT